MRMTIFPTIAINKSSDLSLLFSSVAAAFFLFSIFIHETICRNTAGYDDWDSN